MSRKTVTRRQLLKASSAMVAGSILSACAAPGGSGGRVVEKTVEVTRVVEVEKEVPAAQPAAEPVELIVMHVHSAYDGFGQNTGDPAFEALNPNVKVKRELVPGWTAEYFPKLIAMHAAGTPWDVAVLPASEGGPMSMYSKGVFKDLGPLVAGESYDLNQFFPAAVAGGKTLSGSFFILPLLIDTGATMLIYNQALLDKAGIATPTPDWRYETDFVEALRKLKGVLAKDEYAIGGVFTSGPYDTEGTLSAYNLRALDDTGRKWQLGDGRGAAFLKFWAGIAAEGLAPPAGELPAGVWDLFNSGKVALGQLPLPIYLWCKGAVAGAFDMGLTYQPKGPDPDGVTAGMANVWGASIHSDTRHVDASWAYLKHFAGAEMAQPLWDVGLVPARVDIWEKNSSAPDADPAYKLTMDLFASCKPVCQAWNFRTAEMWTAYSNVAANVWLGKVEVDQGIQDVTTAVNEVLDLPAA